MFDFVSLQVLKNDLLLHEAVIKNEADTVRKVLKETVDVDSRNNVSRRKHFRYTKNTNVIPRSIWHIDKNPV